tara:strand:- start:900 stop:1190 length:291 start_codon:yes stop_codon:yes gene_type:complete
MTNKQLYAYKDAITLHKKALDVFINNDGWYYDEIYDQLRSFQNTISAFCNDKCSTIYLEDQTMIFQEWINWMIDVNGKKNFITPSDLLLKNEPIRL